MTNSVFLTPLIEDSLDEVVDAKRNRLSLADSIARCFFKQSPRFGGPLDVMTKILETYRSLVGTKPIILNTA